MNKTLDQSRTITPNLMRMCQVMGPFWTKIWRSAHPMLNRLLMRWTRGEVDRVRRLIAPLHAADVADLLGLISPADRAALLNAFRMF